MAAAATAKTLALGLAEFLEIPKETYANTAGTPAVDFASYLLELVRTVIREEARQLPPSEDLGSHAMDLKELRAQTVRADKAEMKCANWQRLATALEGNMKILQGKVITLIAKLRIAQDELETRCCHDHGAECGGVPKTATTPAHGADGGEDAPVDARDHTESSLGGAISMCDCAGWAHTCGME